MKKISMPFIFAVLAALSFTSTSFGQLKVLSTGRVDIYNQHLISASINNDMLDIVNGGANVSSGNDLIWANYTLAQPNNPGLLKLATNYSSKFVVKSNGYVGISITEPRWELDVIGVAKVNGSVILTSDIQLKDNIQSISNARNSIMRLNAINYNFKYSTEDFEFKAAEKMDPTGTKTALVKNVPNPDFYNRKHNGFSAQDMQEVFPELVFEDSEGILGIDYIGLIPVMVEAMKEQQAEIEDLKARINELEAVKTADK